MKGILFASYRMFLIKIDFAYLNVIVVVVVSFKANGLVYAQFTIVTERSDNRSQCLNDSIGAHYIALLFL